MKRCPHCGTEKAHSEFARNRARYDGLSPWCRACNNDEQHRRWAADPARHNATNRRSKLKRLYGLTPAEFDAMVSDRGGRCDICAQVPSGSRAEGRVLHVDHDHETGAIRGLLCGPCNRAIGLLGDSAEGVTRALAYLLGVWDLTELERAVLTQRNDES